MSLGHTRIGPFDVYQLPNGKIQSVIIHKTKENLQLKTYQILYALGPQLRYPFHKKIRYISEQVFDETANAYQANRYDFGSARARLKTLLSNAVLSPKSTMVDHENK